MSVNSIYKSARVFLILCVAGGQSACCVNPAPTNHSIGTFYPPDLGRGIVEWMNEEFSNPIRHVWFRWAPTQDGIIRELERLYPDGVPLRETRSQVDRIHPVVYQLARVGADDGARVFPGDGFRIHDVEGKLVLVDSRQPTPKGKDSCVALVREVIVGPTGGGAILIDVYSETGGGVGLLLFFTWNPAAVKIGGGMELGIYN